MPASTSLTTAERRTLTRLRLSSQLISVLADAGNASASTREEMHTVFEGVGISPDGQARYHTLWFLSQTGTLCLGPPQGKQQTFVLLEEWVREPRRLDREEALGELALRYFLSHGPATIRDFAWWSSLTLTEARTGLAIARPSLIELELGGTAYYLSPELADKPAPAGTQLLPGFDEYLLGYQDRSAALAKEHTQYVFPGKNGMFLSTIVHDGAVVGTWKRTITPRQVTITPSPFAPPDTRAFAGITQPRKITPNFSACRSAWMLDPPDLPLISCSS